MRTVHYVLIGLALIAVIVIGALLRSSGGEDVDVTDVDWRDFNCATDGGKPYISLLKNTDRKYDLSVLIPVCWGSVTFTSAGFGAKGIYEVLFTATGTRTPGDTTVKTLLVQNVQDIPSIAAQVKVIVRSTTSDETTTVVTADADDESSGIPLNEVLAMHYDGTTYTLSGFAYGNQPYDPVPTTWLRNVLPVDLGSVPPTAKTTFVRNQMSPPSAPAATYRAQLRYSNGTAGRSFAFKPSLNN